MGRNDADLIDSLGDFLGKEVADVVLKLRNTPDYSEFKLAEALGKEVNETRNFLYKLHNANLASFIKKKDNKIGWYIYYWTFHEDRLPAFLVAEKKNKYEHLKERISKENKSSFFSCVNKCLSVDFDKAFEFSFYCPECGGLLEQENNEVRTAKWVHDLEKLEKEIKKLEIKVLKIKKNAEKESAPSSV